MSLQKAIEANTEALLALTARLSGGIPVAAVPAETFHEIREAAAEENLQEVTLDYDKDVKPWAVKLCAKDKIAFTDILAAHSVKKGSEVPAQHLPTLLASIKRALGE